MLFTLQRAKLGTPYWPATRCKRGLTRGYQARVQSKGGEAAPPGAALALGAAASPAGTLSFCCRLDDPVRAASQRAPRGRLVPAAARARWCCCWEGQLGACPWLRCCSSPRCIWRGADRLRAWVWRCMRAVGALFSGYPEMRRCKGCRAASVGGVEASASTAGLQARLKRLIRKENDARLYFPPLATSPPPPALPSLIHLAHTPSPPQTTPGRLPRPFWA